MKDHYVCQYPTGEFVGIDKVGVPYQTEYPGFVFFWTDKKLADQFVVDHKALKLKVRQMEFTIF